MTICNYEAAANPADHKVESIVPQTNFISWSFTLKEEKEPVIDADQTKAMTHLWPRAVGKLAKRDADAERSSMTSFPKRAGASRVCTGGQIHKRL